MSLQRGLRSRRGKRNPVTAIEISLTPLIDTVLVLLITFMVAMPVMQNALNVELPTGAANDAIADGKARSITVYIDRNNILYLNDKMVRNREELMQELVKLLSASREEVVYIGADCHVLYETVAHIIDDIKYLGGVRYVALATKNG